MTKSALLVFVFCLFWLASPFVPRASGQTASRLSIEAAPTAVVPVGENARDFGFGFGASLAGRATIGSSPLITGLTAAYSFVPTPAGNPLSLMDGGGLFGLLVRPGDDGAVEIETAARFGGYASVYRDEAGFNPYAGGYAAVRFRFSPALSLGVSSGYGYYSDFSEDGSLTAPLFEGVNASLSLRWSPGANAASPTRPRIHIDPPQFDRVFPVFYRYYDEAPLGTVTLRNEERSDIDNVRVSFFVPQYMDAPKVVAELPSVPQDEEFQVELRALFVERILEITETTSVQAQIIVEYERDGTELVAERSETLEIQNRNQMTWDDDRKAAAFVTAGDPAVQRLSRNVTAVTRQVGSSAVNERLRQAMAIHETVGLLGIEYVVDPDSSYIELSQNEATLDYLQFPAQTLDFRAGDCDDLSILYCSLLESIGVPTAFVTIPGHIFMAIDLGISESEAERTFASTDELIMHDGRAWLPIEATVPGDSFLQAWGIGARQYREHRANDAVGFYPVREAWGIYAPTGFRSNAPLRDAPSDDAIATRYDAVLTSFVERELTPQVQSLEERIARRSSPRLLNRLGALYARYGLYDRARESFERVLDTGEYAEAHYNIGNLYYLEGDLSDALRSYDAARTLSPDDPSVRLGLARTHFELEQYEAAAREYEEVRILAPALAEDFAYIVSETSESGRASAAATRATVIWEDD